MAPPRRAPAARARPRRGSVDRPINARMVRGTWLLVALPLLLAAFTVGRPEPLPPPALPPAFDAATAGQLARELARDYPDRSPGSSGALGASDWVRRQLALYGFETQVDRFRARIPGRGPVELGNIVAVVRGSTQRAIVVTAHRDNSGEGRGANDNASGTGALIELARAYAPASGTTAVQTRPTHTLVFVSTDGGASGALGAARFADTSPYAAAAVAVLSLDAIAGPGPPRLLIGGDTARSPAASLVRTAALRVLEESGEPPVVAGALRQLLDLGFPFTLGEQGPFVARGVPALTLTTVTERPARAFADAGLHPQRLDELGRAAQNLIGSVDGGLELAQGASSYVYIGTRIVRGWAIELVLLASLLPFAIGAIDLFARCRRRRIPLAPALRSLRSRLLFWGYAGLLLFAAARLGVFGEGEPRPLPPAAPGLGEPSAVAVGVIGTLLLAGWLVGRERLIPRRPVTFEETLAGHTIALLALGLIALVLVATNPFALIYLLPSLYAWLWLPQAQGATPAARGALLTLGLSGPLILLVSLAERLGLGFEAPSYLLSLVAVGYVPAVAVALGLGWLAVAAQLAALAGGRYAPYPEAGERPLRAPFRGLLRRMRVAFRRRPADDRDVMEG